MSLRSEHRQKRSGKTAETSAGEGGGCRGAGPVTHGSAQAEGRDSAWVGGASMGAGTGNAAPRRSASFCGGLSFLPQSKPHILLESRP